MTNHFITFGGGHEKYIDAGKRLINQMRMTGLFHHHELYTDIYLQNDQEFWRNHEKFVKQNRKGYGCWIWKPYILKKKVETLKNGDIVMYLDGGCEFDTKKTNLLKDFLEKVKSEYIIGTQCGNENGGLLEKYWTKADLFHFLGVNEPRFLETPQRQGGTLLFYLNDQTRNLINEWYNVACCYHNIDDSPSIEKNVVNFQEHRHDQSIFSLLSKKHNLFSELSLYNCGVLVVRNISKYSISDLKKRKRGTMILSM